MIVAASLSAGAPAAPGRFRPCHGRGLRNGVVLTFNQEQLDQVLSAHAALRQFDEAAIIDGRRQILANANVQPPARLRSRSSRLGLQPGARGSGRRACRARPATGCARWSSSIPSADSFLYVGRLVDREVLAHVQNASSAAHAYQDLEHRRSGVQITFAFIFVVVALLILFASIWLALVFASQLVRPDRPAGRRGRAGAQRRSLGAGERGPGRTTKSAG